MKLNSTQLLQLSGYYIACIDMCVVPLVVCQGLHSVLVTSTFLLIFVDYCRFTLTRSVKLFVDLCSLP